MSEPCKCDCQKLVIALLDRADALHREEVAMIECGNAGAYSKLMKLQAENERLRTNLDYVLDDWGHFKAGHSGGHGIDSVFKAWLAAKETQP